MPRNEILDRILKALIFSDKVQNQGDMAAKLGYKGTYFSAIMNGHNPINEEFAERLEKGFDVNRNFTLTGNGDMFNATQRATESNDAKKPAVDDWQAKYYESLETRLIELKDRVNEKNDALRFAQEVAQAGLAAMGKELKELLSYAVVNKHFLAKGLAVVGETRPEDWEQQMDSLLRARGVRVETESKP